MLGLGTGEIIIVGAIVMLLFGGKKLPELGKGMAQGLRGFQEGLREKGEEKKDEKLS